jgi:hypothetical protein
MSWFRTSNQPHKLLCAYPSYHPGLMRMPLWPRARGCSHVTLVMDVSFSHSLGHTPMLCSLLAHMPHIAQEMPLSLRSCSCRAFVSVRGHGYVLLAREYRSTSFDDDQPQLHRVIVLIKQKSVCKLHSRYSALPSSK